MGKASVSPQVTDDLLDQPGCSGCPSNFLDTLLLAVGPLPFRPKSLRMEIFAHCNDTLNQHHWKTQNPAQSCALGSAHHHLLGFISSKPDFSENWVDLVSWARESSVKAAIRVDTSSSKSHKANPEPNIPRDFLISWSDVLPFLESKGTLELASMVPELLSPQDFIYGWFLNCGYSCCLSTPSFLSILFLSKSHSWGTMLTAKKRSLFYLPKPGVRDM